MSIKYKKGPAPEWTAEAWEAYVSEVENNRVRALRGDLNPDGSRTIIFDDGKGLDQLRLHVGKVHDDVAALEELWGR